MFYVVGTKVYLADFNESKKVYPEVRLVKETDGRIIPEILDTGVSVKPKNREICTLKEVLAKFGADATVRSKKVIKE